MPLADEPEHHSGGDEIREEYLIPRHSAELRFSEECRESNRAKLERNERNEKSRKNCWRS